MTIPDPITTAREALRRLANTEVDYPGYSFESDYETVQSALIRAEKLKAERDEAHSWLLVNPLPTSRGHAYGDWRDIRACLEALVVDYMSLPDHTRDALWKFAEALPKVHPAMTFNCSECGKTFSRVNQYRCADCHATCCENCIRPHFGPNHQPHNATDRDVKIANLEKENDHLRATLANGPNPCVYCNLPKDDWQKCADGFPGCARADDAMLCPHVGSSLEADAKITRLTSQLEQAERVIKPFADVSDTLHSGYDAGMAAGDRPTARVSVSDLRAAAQWIKDLQAKGEG